MLAPPLPLLPPLKITRGRPSLLTPPLLPVLKMELPLPLLLQRALRVALTHAQAVAPGRQQEPALMAEVAG